MDEEKEKRYGFYSAKASEHCGSAIWLDSLGNNVEVTCVCRSKEWPDYKWDDKVLVGEVVEYAHAGIPRGMCVLSRYPRVQTQANQNNWKLRNEHG